MIVLHFLLLFLLNVSPSLQGSRRERQLNERVSGGDTPRIGSQSLGQQTGSSRRLGASTDTPASTAKRIDSSIKYIDHLVKINKINPRWIKGARTGAQCEAVIRKIFEPLQEYPECPPPSVERVIEYLWYKSDHVSNAFVQSFLTARGKRQGGSAIASPEHIDPHLVNFLEALMKFHNIDPIWVKGATDGAQCEGILHKIFEPFQEYPNLQPPSPDQVLQYLQHKAENVNADFLKTFVAARRNRAVASTDAPALTTDLPNSGVVKDIASLLVLHNVDPKRVKGAFDGFECENILYPIFEPINNCPDRSPPSLEDVMQYLKYKVIKLDVTFWKEFVAARKIREAGVRAWERALQKILAPQDQGEGSDTDMSDDRTHTDNIIGRLAKVGLTITDIQNDSDTFRVAQRVLPLFRSDYGHFTKHSEKLVRAFLHTICNKKFQFATEVLNHKYQVLPDLPPPKPMTKWTQQLVEYAGQLPYGSDQSMDPAKYHFMQDHPAVAFDERYGSLQDSAAPFPYQAPTDNPLEVPQNLSQSNWGVPDPNSFNWSSGSDYNYYGTQGQQQETLADPSLYQSSTRLLNEPGGSGLGSSFLQSDHPGGSGSGSYSQYGYAGGSDVGSDPQVDYSGGSGTEPSLQYGQFGGFETTPYSQYGYGAGTGGSSSHGYGHHQGNFGHVQQQPQYDVSPALEQTFPPYSQPPQGSSHSSWYGYYDPNDPRN